MKYYFVTLQLKNEDDTLYTDIIDVHPLEYQKIHNANKRVYTGRVVWWTELTEEEYDKYK